VSRNQSPLHSCGKPGSFEDHALAGQFLNFVQDKVSDLLANGVVPSGIVIGRIFLACDEQLRVEELEVGASANFSDRVHAYQHPSH